METIGDAYMVVCGAPDKDAQHAQRICDMAFDMVEAITDLKDPSTGNKNDLFSFKVTRFLIQISLNPKINK